MSELDDVLRVLAVLHLGAPLACVGVFALWFVWIGAVYARDRLRGWWRRRR